MDHIETAILNCYGIREAEQNMVFAARLTQHGHTIQSIPYCSSRSFLINMELNPS